MRTFGTARRAEAPGSHGFRKRLECARLEVPRDYGAPGRSTMQVQLIRLKATGPGKRLGSLVLNPGGPGASGVNYLIDSGSAFARLGQRYDIVSFDPRGTGHTEPVSCGSKLAPPPGTGPDSLAAKEKRINEACGRYSGGLLKWVGTPDVARDMDVLRAAVRDDKLNYLGFSYGTKLGAVYAHEFPHKVGRMVLDSVEDPTKNAWQTALSQARGFQKALDEFSMRLCPCRGLPAGHRHDQGGGATAPLVPGVERPSDEGERGDGGRDHLCVRLAGGPVQQERLADAAYGPGAAAARRRLRDPAPERRGWKQCRSRPRRPGEAGRPGRATTAGSAGPPGDLLPGHLGTLWRR